jgi:hypothetical protein
MLVSRGDIVNHMLRTIGERGVSYTQSQHPTVQTCNAVLDSEDLEFQQKGWWFNTEFDFNLAPDPAGEVHLPPKMLQFRRTNVAFMSKSEKIRYTQRDGKLYDTKRHTFKIDTYVSVTLVVALDIADLPPVARNYLKHKAAERMYLDDEFEEGKLSRLADHRLRAWHDVMSEQFRATGMNALDSPNAQNMMSGLAPGALRRNPNLIGGRG